MKPHSLHDISFLTHFQTQIDLVHSKHNTLSNSAEFPVLIDRIRGYISVGNYVFAKELLKTITPNNFAEGGEYAVEILRVLMHEKRFTEAVEVGLKIVHQPGVVAAVKQSLLLLIGESLIEEEMYTEARKIALKAIEFSENFPYAMASLHAFALMVRQCIAVDERAQAEHFLGRAESHLHSLGFDRYSATYLQRLHTIRRAQVLFKEKYGTHDEVLSLLFGNVQICRWLDTQDKLFKDQSDLNLFLQRNDIKNHIRIKNQIVFSGWTFLIEENLILLFIPRSIVYLDIHQMILPLLSQLKSGEISSWALYEKVWKKAYDHEESEAALRVHLSRLRKLLPAGAVNNINGKIFLK